MRNKISDTGISVVYAPDEGDPLLDIVIVHGLQGHPFKTWASNKTPNASSGPESSLPGLSKKRKSGHRYFLRRVVSKVSTKHAGEAASTEPDRSEPSITNANDDAVSVFWPGDLAPGDCPRSRILVYGYDTKVSKYMSAPTNKNHVFSHGKDLLYALGRARKKDRSLVFLAHSLGGIVVKEALAASSTSADVDDKNVIESTVGVIFLGTPHRGSPDLSALGEWARSVLSIFRMETTSVILDTLGLKTSDLERAQESFSGLWRKYDFRVKTFQEGLGLSGVHLGVLGNKVVSDTSSLLGDPRERAETIQANHMDMCRFTGAQDPNYHKIAGELRSIYQSVQEKLNENNVRQDKVILHKSLVSRCAPSARNAREVIPNESEAFLQKLKFPTMDLRYRSIPDPVENTCYWFFVNKKYLDWLEGQKINSHHGLLLLRGKPGAGKSVLLKEAYRRQSLEQTKSDCITAAFFFNAQGEEMERSVVGMFRSLLYQILPMHREHLSLFESLRDSGSLKMPERHLQALVRSLLCKPLKERTFIFIDALDECDPTSIRDITYFWREVTKDAYKSGAKLNVLMSTRDFPHVGLSNCPEIRVDDCNKLAINIYIRQKLKLANMPERMRHTFSETLAAKSSGVFLWVEFALKTMLEKWDEGQGPSALMDHRKCPPCGLEPLFEDILKPTDGAMKQMTIRLFQWAALAIVPLRLHEWHHILAFIRQPELHSLHDWRKSEYFTENDDQLEKQIRNLSRGLLEIRTVSTVDEGGSEKMSTRAGAGSLDNSHGETRVVEFIHQSVREFFLEGRGFSSLDPSLKENPCAKGHLQIMETCLNYLDIYELNKLVEARKQVLEPEDHVQEVHRGKEPPESSSSPKRAGLAGRGYGPDENVHRFDPAPEGQKRHGHSFLESLKELSMGASGIDVGQWVTSNQIQTRPGTIIKSQCSSASRPSTGASTKVLPVYAALLSYATQKLFWHAKKAQIEGANPKAIIHRLQKGSWARWLLLSQAEPPNMQLYDFAGKRRLTSWCSQLCPELLNVESQIAQRSSHEHHRSEFRVSAAISRDLGESDEVQGKNAPSSNEFREDTNDPQANDETDHNLYDGGYEFGTGEPGSADEEEDYSFFRWAPSPFVDDTVNDVGKAALGANFTVDWDNFSLSSVGSYLVNDSVECFGSAASHGSSDPSDYDDREACRGYRYRDPSDDWDPPDPPGARWRVNMVDDSLPTVSEKKKKKRKKRYTERKEDERPKKRKEKERWSEEEHTGSPSLQT